MKTFKIGTFKLDNTLLSKNIRNPDRHDLSRSL